MKTFTLIPILLAFNLTGLSQSYYIRGEVKNESGNELQNVKILQHSTKYVFKSGTYGAFGINTFRKIDTLSFSMDGYETQLVAVNAEKFVTIKLKLLPASASIRRNKLASVTKDLTRDAQRKWFTGDETYASIVENKFINADRFPSTGLALNVDKASYSNVRRFINMKSIVPPDAVRVEEMLNYFNDLYEPPPSSDLFSLRASLTDCPWNPAGQLYFVNVSSRKLQLESLPPTHLVFLIDVSGSMDMPNRLPLLKSAFKLLIQNLRAKDTVSMVIYGGVTGVKLNPTSGAEKDSIIRAIDELEPGGSTPGESGIQLAYRIARHHFIKGGNNRVVLATDGDFNVGLKTEDELDEMITQHRQSGIYLTCLGVGMGNYKDSKIQTLARKGNGNFAYLDNFQEAEKVLMKEFTQTLYAVADDVYMDVSFSDYYVKEYRLIGFDNKVGAIADSLSAIEGGEIGSGQTMMAAFEIIPTAAGQEAADRMFGEADFAALTMRYSHCGDTAQLSSVVKAPYTFTPYEQIDKKYKFATALIMFGSMLRHSAFTKTITWNDIIAMAYPAADINNINHKEFLDLLQRAKDLYAPGKKKKRKEEELSGY